MGVETIPAGNALLFCAGTGPRAPGFAAGPCSQRQGVIFPQREVTPRCSLPCRCQIKPNRWHRTKKPLLVSRATNSAGAADPRDSEAETSAAAPALGGSVLGPGSPPARSPSPQPGRRTAPLPAVPSLGRGLLTSTRRPCPSPGQGGRSLLRHGGSPGPAAASTRPARSPGNRRCKHRRARDVT